MKLPEKVICHSCVETGINKKYAFVDRMNVAVVDGVDESLKNECYPCHLKFVKMIGADK